jgi:hypothetical protein
VGIRNDAGCKPAVHTAGKRGVEFGCILHYVDSAVESPEVTRSCVIVSQITESSRVVELGRRVTQYSLTPPLATLHMNWNE